MHHSTKPRLAFVVAIASIAAAALASACSDDSTSAPATGTPDGSTSKGDDSASTDDDKDAGGDAKPGRDPNGPGADGDKCSLNRDCQAALRCECDEDTGCFCEPGARGTGRNGIDPCESGNDCVSSLCVLGPDNDESICSDECKNDSECGGKLPRCLPVVGIPEPICKRIPPQ